MQSPRPRSTRQALAGLQYAIGTVARPNPLVLIWRWRYELIMLIMAAGIPAAMILLAGTLGAAWTVTAAVTLAGTAALWPAPRRYLVARAWCVITPHRVRTGCAQAWIHSRRGKVPIVLLTTRRPFGERLRLWCRAGTSAEDFTSARELLIAACWAQDIQVRRSSRFAQVVTLDVIRHANEDMPGPHGVGRHIEARPALPGSWTDAEDGHRPRAGLPGEDEAGHLA